MKNKKSHLTILIGAALVVCGVFLIKTLDTPNKFMIVLLYICVVIGSGIFGHGMGNFIEHKALQNSPEIKRQIAINRNDERNIVISHCAKAKAYDLMTYVFGALLPTFGLMGMDIVPLLLFAFAYVFVQVYALYFRLKFEKEL